MVRATHQLVCFVIACAGASSVALAGLKAKAPDGVTLAGTQWQINRYDSDDPSEALDRASRARLERRPSDPERPVGGGVFGSDPPAGRNPVGGGYGLPSDRDVPVDRDRSGTWRKSSGGNSTEIDPTGSHESITMQMGGGRRSIFFESLRTNPDKLTFSAGKQYVTVNADGLETECEAGIKEHFSDSYGDGERSCGWNGRAWVIETTRGRDFSRTDRYELSKDGKTLKYTTTAVGDGLGRVTITRRYQIPPANN